MNNLKKNILMGTFLFCGVAGLNAQEFIIVPEPAEPALIEPALIEEDSEKSYCLTNDDALTALVDDVVGNWFTSHINSGPYEVYFENLKDRQDIKAEIKENFRDSLTSGVSKLVATRRIEGETRELLYVDMTFPTTDYNGEQRFRRMVMTIDALVSLEDQAMEQEEDLPLDLVEARGRCILKEDEDVNLLNDIQD